jgi:hypothetical protein
MYRTCGEGVSRPTGEAGRSKDPGRSGGGVELRGFVFAFNLEEVKSPMGTLTVNDEQAVTTTKAPGSSACDGRDGEPPGGGSSLERVIVDLSPLSVAALDGLVRQTGQTKTDSINKALQVYAYIQQLMCTGGALYVRDTADGKLERLRIY